MPSTGSGLRILQRSSATLALARFLLAYLANGSEAGQSAATHFWQAATSPVPSDSNHDSAAFGRLQTLSNAHKHIYGLHGYEPPE